MTSIERETIPTAKRSSRPHSGRVNFQHDKGSYSLHDLVSSYPPLTAEETRKNLELLQKGINADYLLENDQNQLTNEEKEALREVQRQGLKAREIVTLHFTQLVLGKAAKYQSSLDIWDLFQEGTIGLMNASENFDPQKGSFPCYATAAIVKEINRAIENQGELVRTPVHGHAKLKNIRETQDILQQELGRAASIEELSAATGIGVKTISALLRNAQRPVSLEKQVGDKDRVLGDLIPDPKAVSPETAALEALQKEVVEKALNCLTPREEDVIRLRFGFTTGEPLTLRGVGQRLGFSGEWVRLIEARALNKLKERLKEER
ncbi:sigma-70 family RNA polymerase sigma factor [Patescibacteria group bacterium]|nr:sigma-70 family RNA polymerase sigma factor [Patescibacteria group bacterium]